jgi:plastocyanin
MRLRLLACALVALVLVPAAAGTGASTIKKVSIHDNYYSPAKLKVKVGTTVKWMWPNDTGDTHDVNVGKRPSGVKPFSSELVAVGYSFKRKLTKPGTYHIYCSLHDEMKMTIRVVR